MGQSALRRLRFAACGADLFADPVAGFVYPAFEGLEVGTTIKAYPRNFQGTDHDRFAPAIGEREAEIKFITDGRGFGGAPAGAGSGVAATQGENGLLFKSVFGTEVLGTGSTATAGTTASSLLSAGNWSVGVFLGFVNPVDQTYHLRQIRTKAGVGPYTYTLDRALPFVPAAASTVYASASYNHAIEGHQHLWFDAEGYDTTPAKGWRRYIRGCLGDVEIQNLSAMGQLKFAWTFRGLDWSDVDQGVSQPAPAYPANLPVFGTFVRSGRLWVDEDSVPSAELGYTLGNEVQVKPSIAAPAGKYSFLITGAEQTLSFKVAVDDAEAPGLRAAHKAGTALDLLIELAQGGPGNSFALAVPVAHIADMKPSTLNGLDYWDVSLQAVRSGVSELPAVTFGIA